MELLVLDHNFEAVDFADEFESRIWTDRYCGCGDFEIYTPVTLKTIQSLIPEYYIWTRNSEHLMVIEDVQIETDVENGSRFKSTGRSVESILDRRIVWAQTVLTGNLQNGIKKLLDENAISPINPDRKIARLIFEASTDPTITTLTVDTQFHGQDLLTAITTLCSEKNIGFKITLSEANELVFKLYAGVDRSYEQTVNPYVIFSQKFENLVNSNYLSSIRPLKTATLIGGEGEGTAMKTASVGGGVGLARREIFTDAKGVSSSVNGGTLTPAQYTLLLEQKGTETLSDNARIETFEGQVETTYMFKYGKQFFLGDIVQIANEYGFESQARVTEYIQSESLTGEEAYPTFVTVQ